MSADTVFPRRLDWRRGPISGDSVDKRAAMARLSALLYLSGGGLGLLSLLLPGDPGRNAAAILAISAAALITIGTLAVAVALIRLLTSRLAAVIHDLSASETAARANGDRLRALIEAAPTAIVELDTAGDVLMWNAAAERIFGWQAAEVLGR